MLKNLWCYQEYHIMCNVYLYSLYIGVYSSIIMNFRQQFGNILLENNLDKTQTRHTILFVYYINVYLYKISRILAIR